MDETQNSINMFPKEDTSIMSEQYLTDVAQGMVNVLAARVNAATPPSIPVEMQGPSTMVRFKRVPGGYKLLVGLRAFNSTPSQLFNRIFHEMVHIVNDMSYTDDTCGNGNYHTEAFKLTAEALGGTAAWKKAGGYSDVSAFQPNKPSPYDNTEYILSKTSRLLKKAKGNSGAASRARIYKVTAQQDIMIPAGTVFFVQGGSFVTEDAFNAQEAADAKRAESVKAKAKAKIPEPSTDTIEGTLDEIGNDDILS